MMYNDALKVWGASKLREHYRRYNLSDLRVEDVVVEMDFNQGYACCGGSDPDCYCSLAESPSANVEIRAGKYVTTISHYEFNFATILGEIVAAGDGTLTD